MARRKKSKSKVEEVVELVEETEQEIKDRKFKEVMIEMKKLSQEARKRAKEKALKD